MEAHHVFPSSFRDKSEEYGFVISLCGDTCHRNGMKAAHTCRETADRLKRFCQIWYMQNNNATVDDFRREFDKNRLELDEFDERGKLMNTWSGSGRLTQDPILRHTEDGRAACSFTVAVNRPGTTDKTDFLDCTAWHNTANFVSKYFKKGKGIEIVGNVIRDDYEKDGKTVKAWKIRVNEVGFADLGAERRAEQEESEEAHNAVDQGAGFTDVGDDEELPF